MTPRAPRLVSPSPTRWKVPYDDLGIVLKSGMWDQPSEDGTIYDARVHPNVVDPDVFYDQDGHAVDGVRLVLGRYLHSEDG